MGNTGDRAVSYDGHLGIDIDVPNFRKMDADYPAYAADAGTVLEVVADQFDRNLICDPGSTWNVVKIRHASGIVSIYGHLRKNSPVVSPGQAVVKGQKIGVVGSSGCSQTAHLHFQVVGAIKRCLIP